MEDELELRRACDWCTRLKRKCERTGASCRHCIHMKRSCVFSMRKRPVTPSAVSSIREKEGFGSIVKSKPVVAKQPASQLPPPEPAQTDIKPPVRPTIIHSDSVASEYGSVSSVVSSHSTDVKCIEHLETRWFTPRVELGGGSSSSPVSDSYTQRKEILEQPAPVSRKRPADAMSGGGGPSWSAPPSFMIAKLPRFAPPSQGQGLVGRLESSLLSTFFAEFGPYLSIITEVKLRHGIRNIMIKGGEPVMQIPIIEGRAQFAGSDPYFLILFWYAVSIGASLQDLEESVIAKYINFSNTLWDSISIDTPCSASVQCLLLRACATAFQGNEPGFACTIVKAHFEWASILASGLESIAYEHQSPTDIESLDIAVTYVSRLVAFRDLNPIRWSIGMAEDVCAPLPATSPATTLVSRLTEAVDAGKIQLFYLRLQGAFMMAAYNGLMLPLEQSREADEFEKSVPAVLQLVLKVYRTGGARNDGALLKCATLSWLAMLKHMARDLEGAAEAYRASINTFESMPTLVKFHPFAHLCENVAAAVRHLGMLAEYERLRNIHNRGAPERIPLPPAGAFCSSRDCCINYLCRELLRRVGSLTLEESLVCLHTPGIAEPEAPPYPSLLHALHVVSEDDFMVNQFISGSDMTGPFHFPI